jgi:hypothetical protein
MTSVNEFDRAWVEALLDKIAPRKGATAPRNKKPLTPYENSVFDAAWRAIGLPFDKGPVAINVIELAFAIARELSNRRKGSVG